MFERNAISAAALITLGAIASTALAQDSKEKLDRVEITGSSIKRVQTEGATPVQVVTREDIIKSGAANAGELLRNLPSMNQDDSSNRALNPTLAGYQGATAPGGFGSGDTLVLLNGRRLSKYPVGGSAVDLNSIPMAVIERVEVLRDGASAIYGSDAVAGVVNIITKRNFTGLNAAFTLGESSRHDGGKGRVALSLGLGDLYKDRFNLMLTAETSRENPIYNKDREITSTADLTRFGLADQRLNTSPNPNVLLPKDPLAFDAKGVAIPGTTPRWQEGWRPIKPCPAPTPAEGVSIPAYVGKVCPFDAQAITLMQPEVKSDALFGQATFLLGNDIEWRNEFFFKSKSSANFLAPQPVTLTSRATDPLNPWGNAALGAGKGVDVTWAWRTVDPRFYRQKAITTDAQRFHSELNGSTAGYDWTVDLGEAKSSYQEGGTGYFITSKWNAALASGVLNPFAGKLNPDDLAPLLGAPIRTAETRTRYANAKVSGSLMKLPAGDALFALGGSVNFERYINAPDPLQLGGLLLGDPRLAGVSASRDNKAVFGEVVVPVLKSLEVSGAVRYDKYNDFGSTTNPKLSVRFQPSDSLLLRGSVGKGFRAPSLEDLFATDVSGFPTAKDYAGCALAGIARDKCPSKQYFQLTKSNSALKPEKSDAFTLGLALTPIKGLFASVDYVRLKKTDQIEALSTQTILDYPNLPVAGFGTAKDLVRRLASGQIDPSTVTPAILAPTANLSALDVKMMDYSVRYETQLLGYRVKLENNLSTLLSSKKSPAPGLDMQEYKGLAGFAKWKNVLSASVDFGNLTPTLYLRSIDGFLDVTEPSQRVGATAVKRVNTVDLNVSYKGLLGKSNRVDFLVRNLGDTMPPLASARNSSNKIDFAHNAVGRYLQVNASFDY